MEEEKVDRRWSKKEKRETRKWGGQNFSPTHLNSAKAESTPKKKKKKKIFFKFSIKKFSFPSFQFHILNA